jgi:hypothetical protein
VTGYARKTDDERREEALVEFHRWSDRLHVDRRSPVWRRVETATRAIRGWRNLSQWKGDVDEQAQLVVRVAAESFADTITAAAGPEHDAATIAWVVAGLRCPSRPFCTGCVACQTVTAPTRPCTEHRSTW